jgi:hypothetical protein
MKILMDTHVFLWFVEGDKRLSALARETIANPSNDLYLSLNRSQAENWSFSSSGSRSNFGQSRLIIPCGS